MKIQAKWFSKKRTAFVAGVLFLVAAGGAWAAINDSSHRPLEVTGTVQAKEIPVASKVGGRIQHVFVEEGQEVTKGQVLVDFEVPELEARRQQLIAAIGQSEATLTEFRNGPRLVEIERARAGEQQAFANLQMLEHGYRSEDIDRSAAQRKEAEENLALLKKGYRKEDIDSARHNMQQAQVQLEWAQKEFARFSLLARQGAVSAREADELRSKMDAAEQALSSAQDNYKKLLAGPRSEEIAAAQQRLEAAINHERLMKKGPRQEEIESARNQYLSARASLKLLMEGTRQEQIARAEARLAQDKALLAELDAQLQDRRVVSPGEAEVSVMDLHAGEIISPNKAIATLTRLDCVWTRVYIPERELGRVHVGQNVIVHADSYPGKEFAGRVVQIPGSAEFTPRNVQTAEERSNQVFGLKVNIDNRDHLLRGGMNAQVTLPPVENASQSCPLEQLRKSCPLEQLAGGLQNVLCHRH